MRKGIISVVMVGLIMLFMISFTDVFQENHSSHENGSEENSSVAEGDILIHDMDDLVGVTTNVVTGEVTSSEPYNDRGAYEFEVSILEEHYGDAAEDHLHVYLSKGDLEEGGKYFFVLTGEQSTRAPHPFYRPVLGHSYIRLDEDVQVRSDMYEGQFHIHDYDMETLIDIFSEAEPPAEIQQMGEDVHTVEEAYDQADLIIRIVPERVTNETQYMALYEMDVLENVRGDFEEPSILLPNDVELGEEYIILLTDTGEGLVPIAADYGIIAQSDIEEWEILSMLMEEE